jgi:hypothetical protein
LGAGIINYRIAVYPYYVFPFLGMVFGCPIFGQEERAIMGLALELIGTLLCFAGILFVAPKLWLFMLGVLLVFIGMVVNEST